jgi:hypothetical protein
MSTVFTPEEALGITPYKVVVPLVALFFIVYAWNHVLRGTKTTWEALLWTLFWGFIAIIVLFPSWIGLLTAWTGIKGQANAVFAIAIGVLLFMVFHMLMRIENLQRRMADLVRHEALKDAGLLQVASERQKELGMRNKE